MKILFVVGGLPFGGVENLLYDVSCELLGRDVEFLIVNLSGTGEKIKEFVKADIPVVNLGKSKKDIKTFKLKTALNLRKFIKEYQPDIVHSMHFSADYFSRLASLGFKRTKIITHIHTIRVEKRRERRLLNKLLSLKTDIFLSVSKSVFEMVEKEHNIAKKPHYILYNAVNFKKFEVGWPEGLEKGYRYLICVGRLVPLKNFDIAIKAFSLIEAKHPDVRLLVVGEGKEKQRLEKLVKDLNLTEKVIFTGYRRDVPALLKASHVFLMPSSYEGFGIAHLEAMYVGLPAIISPYVPSKEIASECSLVVPIEPSRVAEALDRLLSDEDFYRKLSIRAKGTAEKFSIENYVDKLLSLYEGVLTNRLPDRVVL